MTGEPVELQHVSEDAPLRLAVAARLAFPGGGMSAAGLRKEAVRGRLVIERIAGKDYVTLAAIQKMRELCRIHRKAPDCGSGQPEEEKNRLGSSETDQSKSALNAALATARRLSKNSPIISPPSTDRSASAAVIPLPSRSPTS
jgi:hypothetical protein